MLAKFDVVIIGGGILGTAISYWLSVLYDIRVCVIEQDGNVALHASGRNTGVVHSPFYMNPQTRKTLARAAHLSCDMWESISKLYDIPWRQTGTIEVAMDEHQHKTLEKYIKWGICNGLSEDEIALLDSASIAKIEPHLKCYSGLLCRRDVSTNYNRLTASLKTMSEGNGVKFFFNSKVVSVSKGKCTTIHLSDGTDITADLVINCAGGNSLDVAQMFGLAAQYSDLHFRGEYWIADAKYSEMIKTNVYSVARFAEFPFLDPHWIRRSDGSAEIGPNAVPVPTPDSYGNIVSDIPALISKMASIMTSGTRRLLANPDFIALVSGELLSSVSKTAMVDRVRRFIPAIEPDFFTRRGTSGIRTPVISPEGRFVPDVMELEAAGSFHIVNYNSPGATGAPAYSAFVIKKLQDMGLLEYNMQPRRSVWSFDMLD